MKIRYAIQDLNGNRFFVYAANRTEAIIKAMKVINANRCFIV